MFDNLKLKIQTAKKRRELRKILNERVPIYCVFKGIPEKDEKTGWFKNIKEHPPLTFCATHDEAECAVRKLTYYKYIDHFRSWAERKIDERDELTHTTTSPEDREKEMVFNGILWVTYYIQVRQEFAENEFPVYCLPYTIEALALFIRLATPCDPIYMSYEDPDELNRYMQRARNDNGSLELPEDISHAMELDADLRAQIQEMYKKIGAEMVERPTTLQDSVLEELDELDEELKNKKS